MPQTEFLTEPPESAALTPYDRAHIKLYLRLLDAADSGAGWRDVAPVLFGLDPDQEPERARRAFDSHLARAHWMTTDGYLLMLNDRGVPQGKEKEIGRVGEI